MSDVKTSARDTILGQVSASLRGHAGDKRLATAQARIADRRRHLTPARALLPPVQARENFIAHLTKGHATVVSLAQASDVPEAVTTYLRNRNQPLRLRMGRDPRLAAMPWAAASGLVVETGHAEAHDEVSLSYALAGVAETGTLVLASGPDNPVTLNYLPETHLVVLDAATLVGAYEDAFDLLRAKLGPGVMPRTVNFVSGPSRTGDIGGKIVMGAHGPRYFGVFIVG